VIVAVVESCAWSGLQSVASTRKTEKENTTARKIERREILESVFDMSI
jgi:hypothetical protein